LSDVPLSAGERRPLWGRPEHQGHGQRDAEGAEDRPTPSAESRPASDEATDEGDVAAAVTNPEVEAAPVGLAPALFDGLRWRSIGPASTGGRIDDFAVARVPGAPDAIYVATAGGGVFKSANQGTSWAPVSPPASRPTTV